MPLDLLGSQDDGLFGKFHCKLFPANSHGVSNASRRRTIGNTGVGTWDAGGRMGGARQGACMPYALARGSHILVDCLLAIRCSY